MTTNDSKKTEPPYCGTADFVYFMAFLTFCGAVYFGGLIIDREGLSASTGAIIGTLIGASVQLVIVGLVLKKIWNMEFYLSFLANNTYSAPVPKQTFQEKPTSAQEPNKPSNPQSDMSKYAPK